MTGASCSWGFRPPGARPPSNLPVPARLCSLACLSESRPSGAKESWRACRPSWRQCVRFETALRVRQPLRFWMPPLVLSGLLLVLLSGCSMVGQIAGVDHSVVPTSFDTRTTALTLQQTDVGGIEIVVARDSGDAAQIDRVRNLLRNEIAQFQQRSEERRVGKECSSRRS